MADLLTVYDDDQANTFIECRVCDKRIRGETQYKVHVTTLQHLKALAFTQSDGPHSYYSDGPEENRGKEDSLVARGIIPRQPSLPQWTDIREYLKYLNLDEPIIGLNALVQIPDFVADDGKTVLKYKCKMCSVEMDLFSMVAHIVGRKHRQKYLELKRPDLVTWHDKETAQKQPGLVAKAKAAVVEKQEGWGTPEQIKRPQEKFGNVGKAGSVSRSSVREQPYLGRDSQRQSSIEDRQPYSNEGRSGRPYDTREKYDQYDGPNPRPYGEHDVRGTLREDYTERAKRDINSRPYGDQGGGMRPPEKGYEDGNHGRKQYSSEDVHGLVSRDYDFQENVYHDGASRNRYNDRDLRIHNSGQSYEDEKYQEGQMDARMYSSYEERRPDMDAMSKYGRGFNEKEERGNFGEYDWARSSYSEDPVPAKKKRKSRFSDATVEEIAFTQTRHFEDYDHKPVQRPQNKQRGPPIQGIPSLFDIPVQDSGSTSSLNPKAESVLDVLNDIKIENMEDAKYLKEKLCTVLKEFQASKGSRSGGHTSVSDYRGGKQMDQQRDAYDNTLRDDPDGKYLENRDFQEDRRYDDGPRNFQDSRQYEGDPRAFQDSRQYEDDPRAFQDSRQYEVDPKAFQEARQYEVDPKAFQEARQYEDDPRMFQEARQYEEDPRGSRDNRHYEEPGRYDNYPGTSSFREARQDADDPRGFPKARLEDKSIDFSESRSYDHDLRVNYEGYSKGTQDVRLHAEGPRSTQEARYYDDDYRGFENVDAGRKWDHQRSSLDDKGPVDERASFGNPHKSYQPPALLGETRMYAGRGQQRSYQDDRHPGDEVYDPFHPSPSPPPASTNSTSLNKIASTLLELVSRR